jgi:hypothetical protein
VASEQALLRNGAVNIQFTSTLTSDDENVIAPLVLKALAGILDLLPIAYAIRIETGDCSVYQHTGPHRKMLAAQARFRSLPGVEPSERPDG